MPCPETPNVVSSQATDKEQLIEPIAFTGTRERRAGTPVTNIKGLGTKAKISVVQEN